MHVPGHGIWRIAIPLAAAVPSLYLGWGGLRLMLGLVRADGTEEFYSRRGWKYAGEEAVWVRNNFDGTMSVFHGRGAAQREARLSTADYLRWIEGQRAELD